MATMSTIFSIENQVLDAKTAIETAKSCIDTERSLNGGLYPENKEPWKSLFDSAIKLQSSLDDVICKLAREFSN